MIFIGGGFWGKSGEMIQFDLRIFFKWVGKNHQLVFLCFVCERGTIWRVDVVFVCLFVGTRFFHGALCFRHERVTWSPRQCQTSQTYSYDASQTSLKSHQRCTITPLYHYELLHLVNCRWLWTYICDPAFQLTWYTPYTGNQICCETCIVWNHPKSLCLLFRVGRTRGLYGYGLYMLLALTLVVTIGYE